MGLWTRCSLTIQNVACDHCCFYEPKEQLSPPFYGLANEAVVYCVLVEDVDTIHVLVLYVNYYRLHDWGGEAICWLDQRGSSRQLCGHHDDRLFLLFSTPC